MVLWAGIILLLQAASGPPAAEESELDLARRAPDVVHQIAVTADSPFRAAISNRVPAARYRVATPHGSSYLEPDDDWDNVARLLRSGPGCGELIAALNDVLSSADEAQVAAKDGAAKALATRSTCPGSALAIKFLADKTRGLGTSGSLGADEDAELVVERLDTAGKVLRRWQFHFVATGTWTTPAGWSAPTEATWLVRETVRDLAEISTLARRGPSAILPKVEVVPVAGVPATFSVRVSPSSLPRTQTLTFTESVWSPKSYEGLARALVGASRGAAANEHKAGSSSLESLTDPQAAVLEREDRRLSAWLTADPLDPAAHEAAALLLVSFALREAAGAFSDVRFTLARLTAHLALAGALRAGAPPSPEGRFAELGRLTLLERQRDALDGLSRLTAASPAQAAWIKALRLRNTADWRILEQPLTATLLERLEYHRALAVSIGGSQPLEAFRRRNQEDIPDWGRVVPVAGGPSMLTGVQTRRPSVESANVFIGPLFRLELREAVAVLGASRGREIRPGELATALNEQPARCVTRDASGRLRVRVLGPGAWARFHQRHIANAMYQTVAYLGTFLASPEQADAFWEKSRAELLNLELMPLVTERVLNLPEGSLGKPADDRARDAMMKSDVCARGRGLWERTPERLTAAKWDSLSNSCSVDRESGPLGHPHRWFDHAIPPGTAFDVSARHSMARRSENGLAILERVRVIAPRDKDILDSYFGLRYRWQGGASDFDAVFAPLVDYDVAVMRKQATYFEGDVERYRQAMARVAAIDPEAWLELGQYLAARDRPTEAVQAFEAAVEQASDRVNVASRVEWLILYYADQHLDDKAVALATEGARTGSAPGLLVMARLQERLGHWDTAERYYKETAERYGQSGELDVFYIRHDRIAADGRHAQETKMAWAQVFPNGRVKLAVGDLQPRPPSRGVEVVRSSAALERQGLVKGVVIVGRDGYRVDDLAQYRALQSFSDDAPATLVVWRDGAYATIVSTMPRPHPIITLRSYTAR